MRITAAVVGERHGEFELREVFLDEPRDGEVLVRVVAAGICHTDSITRHGDLPFPLPGVLGHEGAGVVEAVGPGVSGVAEGDHVVLGWPWCGECRNCLDGQPRYCLRLGDLLVGGGRDDGSTALRGLDGSPLASHFFGQSSFATHAVVPWRGLVPVEGPLELLGPMACGLSTGAGAVLNVLKPHPGSSLVVYGAGTVGLAAIMAARNSGATRIIAVDRHESRLALARRFGATDTVNVAVDEPVAAVHEICSGPADFSLECTGVVAVCRQAVDSVGMRGTCALIGGAPAGARVELDHLSTLWGKRVVGVLGGEGRSTALITTLVDLHRQGRFPFDELVTHFPFGAVGDAMRAAEAGEVIKPVLLMP
ncbi:NAD(P)-dependent alcohol dehydrogenase [Lentzea sp. BCCO 10_0798]|uniref:NAD(P)-dependent alcohol dehydrogenase n=1 Tax=Lentzea kristufekii TaxID=3095430 RepID=A0ABU4TS42_9PSEU|nr:NAD(P)-dependent alcohol dehydrogenase [Lentzea sp. BCCO 10_0798]MDX8051112.1 NAD(P)-dependent alcohol dehydrogenase [Lentzea sp. BCCO 10_0798]